MARQRPIREQLHSLKTKWLQFLNNETKWPEHMRLDTRVHVCMRDHGSVIIRASNLKLKLADTGYC